MFKPAWKKLKIAGRKGLLLSALQYESEKGRSIPGHNRGLVIVCHGFTGTKEGGGRAVDMGEALGQIGFSTLLFDFAGCGDSEGKWENLTLTGQVEDLGAVVACCRQEGYRRIILNGRSFGGTTAICYAARDNDIDAVCTWAAVARPRELFQQRAKNTFTRDGVELVNLKSEEGTVVLKKDFFEDLKNHDIPGYAGMLSPCSLKIIHGSADQSVPVEDAKLLYSRAGKPKSLAVIKGADHRFSDHTVETWQIFFDWLKIIN